MGTIIGQAATGFGYTVDDASIFGALFIVGGIVGSVIFGVWVENTRSYKNAMVVICFLSTIFTGANYLVMPTQDLVPTCIVCFLQGAAMVPVMAVAFDFGVELSYPIGESYSTGVIISTGQSFGIIWTIISSVLIDNQDGDEDTSGLKTSFLILTISCAVGTFMCLFIKQELKRYNIEKMQEGLK